MTVTLAPGTPKKFRRTPWRFQQTVARPQDGDLSRFVSALIQGQDIIAGTVAFDGVVFNPARLASLCPAGFPLIPDASISAGSAKDLHALLVAALADRADFLCIPTPKACVFYADNDDWITFYANRKSHLHQVIAHLTAHGCPLVPDWRREF
ncbi:MAG TPA: hypothetical protein VL527_02465 [Dongiaceae bacterium]|jgi:hypothetical protein|nr:hypothetical protein [Dongiaceae bacterium]